MIPSEYPSRWRSFLPTYSIFTSSESQAATGQTRILSGQRPSLCASASAQMDRSVSGFPWHTLQLKWHFVPLYPNPKIIIYDRGCTTTLISSFENCSNCKPRITRIKTTQGGVVMETTHVCMKTYYVRTQTGGIYLITTKLSYVQS